MNINILNFKIWKRKDNTASGITIYYEIDGNEYDYVIFHNDITDEFIGIPSFPDDKDKSLVKDLLSKLVEKIIMKEDYENAKSNARN